MASTNDVKRRRLECVANSSISLSTLAEVIGTLQKGEDVCCTAKTISRDLQACLDIHTPYGYLIQKAPLQLDNGKTYDWSYCNPAALLHIGCNKSRRLASLVEASSATNPAELILYNDETTPGNQLRPDNAREQMCMYYSFKQFPDWFRSRKFGWFFFSSLKTSILETVVGGLSTLIAVVLKVFFMATFNM